MRISDWSSDVCSSDLHPLRRPVRGIAAAVEACQEVNVVGRDPTPDALVVKAMCGGQHQSRGDQRAGAEAAIGDVDPADRDPLPFGRIEHGPIIGPVYAWKIGILPAGRGKRPRSADRLFWQECFSTCSSLFSPFLFHKTLFILFF